MSIRFDNVADGLRRTTGLLDTNSPYAALLQFYPISYSLVEWRTIFMVGVTEYSASDYLQINTNTPNLLVLGVNGTELTASVPSTGAWHKIAIVRENSTSLKLYVNDSLVQTNTTSVSARTENFLAFGKDSSASENAPDCRIAGIKIWSASKTLAEIAVESQLLRPLDPTSLYGWWPVFPGSGERVRDYSGNGRDWTEVGTLTDEAPPPISWGAPLWVVPWAAPAQIDYLITKSSILVRQDIHPAYQQI